MPTRGVFGEIAENYTPPQITFEGTPDQLGLAMERAFVVRPRPVSLTKKSGRSKKKQASAAVRQFDRNRDGATEGELTRAQHMITNVHSVSDAVKQRFAQKLDSLTRDLTEFLVQEIAPYESALETSIIDAGDTLRLITGLESAEFTFGKARVLMDRLSELKMLDWICSRLKLPADIRSMVLEDYMGTDSVKQKTNGIDVIVKKLHELQEAGSVSRSAQERDARMQATRTRTQRGPAVERSNTKARTSTRK